MKRRVKLKTSDRHDSNPEESSEPQPSGSGETTAGLTHRSSWHGASLEESATSNGDDGIVARSSSQGNLQQVRLKSRPRLRLFNRRSLPVNFGSNESDESDQSEVQGASSQSTSPKHKSGQSGLRSLFENIHRKRQASKRKDEIPESESKSKDTEQNNDSETRSSNSPEIEGFPIFRCDSTLSDERRRRSDSSLLEERREGISQTSDMQRSRSSGSNLGLAENLDTTNQSELQTASRAQIQTFQRTQTRGTPNQSRFSIFGRPRSHKTVIKNVEENLTHPAILGILSILNFLLWIFLSSAKVCRISAVVALWLWLKMAYTFEFLVKLFYRIFNLDPDKVNQNNDYTHIEGT